MVVEICDAKEITKTGTFESVWVMLSPMRLESTTYRDRQERRDYNAALLLSFVVNTCLPRKTSYDLCADRCEAAFSQMNSFSIPMLATLLVTESMWKAS